ncbi:MAG: cyclopropane-fatty-acyl-phospholipid synthase [Verrucomicrobiota bacterium]
MSNEIHMIGGGFYNANSSPQRDALLSFLPILESSLPDLPVDSSGPIRLMDVGSSEGGNAIVAQTRIINQVRCLTDRPIQPILCDLPGNDFTQVFLNLFPNGKCVFDGGNVYPTATAGSAYGRLVPDESVDVVTTFNMLGWLSHVPDTRLRGTIISDTPSPYAKGRGEPVHPEDLKPVQAIGQQDLRDFFTARAQELKPGGFLLAQTFGRLGENSTAHGSFDSLNDSFVDLVNEGVLTREAYDYLIYPTIFRDLEDFVAPLKEDAYLRDSFEIVSAETIESPIAFNLEFKKTGDVVTWAHKFSNFVRAYSEPAIQSKLPKDLDRAAITDRLFQRQVERMIEDPERYTLRYISVGVLLRKK